MTDAERCLDALRQRGETLSTAESLTAGLIASTLANVPGASDVLRGGVVAYATDVKTSVLGVDEQLVDDFGVISAECAAAMAGRARIVLGSNWAVSATGVAGPDEQDGHAAGTVYVAVAGPVERAVRALELRGDRQQIRAKTVEEALDLLASVLAEVEPRAVDSSVAEGE